MYTAFSSEDDLLLFSLSIHGLEVLVPTATASESGFLSMLIMRSTSVLVNMHACPRHRQV